MKTSRIAISLTFILITAIFAFAQTEKPQFAALTKIAYINFEALEDEKTGIRDFMEIYKKLDEEFKSQAEELKTIFEKHQKLFKEIEELNFRCKTSPECSETLSNQIQSKLKEYDLSACKLNKKQQEVKTIFDKRKAELSSEVVKKIAAALKQFAKERGFLVIFDKTKIENILIESNDDFPDVTNEFINFYNENSGKLKSQ